MKKSALKRYVGKGRLKAVKVACLHQPQEPCLCGCEAYHLATIKKVTHIICDGCKARKVFTDGPERMHDSIVEWERSEYLLAMQAEGHIEGLEFHPHIEHFPGRPNGYTADFKYWETGDFDIFEDVKGVADANWKWIVALWKGVNSPWVAPGVLREVKRGEVRAWVTKDYRPKGGA